jgi:glutamate synthase domain-containing protein 3
VIKIALLATMLSVSAAAVASAQTSTFYGPAGQYQGQAVQSGNTTTLYGPAGQYQGQTVRPPSFNSGFGLR